MKLAAPAGLLLLLPLLVVVYIAFGRSTEAETADARLLLVTPDEAQGERLGPAIERFEAAGFEVTHDVARVEALVQAGGVSAMFVTHETFDDLPVQTWRDLYLDHAIVGGLDVSLHQLGPLANPSRPVGASWLHYTPERPIFSLLYQSSDCATGIMSDWLHNWPELDQMVVLRLEQIREGGGTAEACAGPLEPSPVPAFSRR